MDESRVARFWAKVDRDGPTPAHCPDLGPCWLWTGALVSTGYGDFFMGTEGGRKVHRLAHRVALEFGLGRPIGSGLFACHHCDVRSCVRPTHLFEGTVRENALDMDAKGRGNREGLTKGHGRVGASSTNAKLTEAQVREIRGRYVPGLPRSRYLRGNARELAHEFDVDESTISDILRRKSWGHL